MFDTLLGIQDLGEAPILLLEVKFLQGHYVRIAGMASFLLNMSFKMTGIDVIMRLQISLVFKAELHNLISGISPKCVWDEGSKAYVCPLINSIEL